MNTLHTTGRRRPFIFVTRKLPPAVEERLRRDYDCDFNDTDRLYDSRELIERASKADAILCCHTEQITDSVISQLANNVKIIANFSVGVDHCSLQAAADKGIIVTNTPDVLSDATAEIAMLCMLGAARRAGEGYHMVRGDRWHDWSPTFMLGSQITGKRFGIVGMGRVGQVAARRARGFDMEVHYHNRRRLPATAEQGAIYHDSLNGLLAVSDVLSLHCPNNPDSKGLLNEERIRRLPCGAIVVNTARGALVDDDALVKGLTEVMLVRLDLMCSMASLRQFIESIGACAMSLYCPIWEAPQWRRVTRWVSGRWIIWTRYSLAMNPATESLRGVSAATAMLLRN